MMDAILKMQLTLLNEQFAYALVVDILLIHLAGYISNWATLISQLHFSNRLPFLSLLTQLFLIILVMPTGQQADLSKLVSNGNMPCQLLMMMI